jgi:fido (protein-threonine AMPylation protein)
MDCPPWSSDRDEHESPECFAGVEEVVNGACRDALSSIPGDRELKDWHRRIFRNFVPLPYYAGGYRQRDPKRICLGVDRAVGGVSAVPYQYVIATMVDLCQFIHQRISALELRWDALPSPNRADELATIVGVAIGRFIQIHPFLNGNGRTSRILWAVLFARFKLPRQFTVVRRPGAPYGEVMGAAMKGDFNPAIAMVARALRSGPLPPPAALPLPN